MTTGIRLARFRARDFRGLHDFAVEIPDEGIEVQGRNEGGKSSLLDAMRALLGGREASGDDVRHGADRARLEGALTDGTEIVRTIPRDGAQRLAVTRDGANVAKPQEHLDELLGGVAAFDPGKFLAADARTQARMVGEAIPCDLTTEHLRRWGIDGKHDLSGHGLTALARVRAQVETWRTEANTRAKLLREDADTARRDAEAVTDLPDAPTVAAAEAEARRAALAHAELLRHREAAAQRIAQNAATRERVLGLRAEADALSAAIDPVSEEAMEESRVDVARCEQRVAELEAALAEARELLKAERAELAKRDAINRTAAEDSRRVASLRQQADALEAAVGGPLEAPTDDAIAAADRARLAAVEAVELSRAVEAAHAARHGAIVKQERAAEALAAADRLQQQVDHLRDQAPAELVRGQLAGIEITDKGVSVGGVPFAKLSTSKRMEIAVRVAILRSPKAGWVQVDNLEAFDARHAAELVAHVHRAGRAFVGAIVSSTDLRVEPVGWTGDVAPPADALPETTPADDADELADLEALFT